MVIRLRTKVYDSRDKRDSIMISLVQTKMFPLYVVVPSFWLQALSDTPCL